MIKEVVLKFRVDADSFKDGNLLLYNKGQGYFYSITPDMFLHEQNAKIKELEQHYSRKEKEMADRVQKIEEEYTNFLKQYQITNGKMIEMIESFVKQYGGKE